MIMKLKSLSDLDHLRTAPVLSPSDIKKLSNELNSRISKADWITVGIMAPNDKQAKKALSSITQKYKNISFNEFDDLKASGNVFLKGNQKTGNVFIRSENGLGEGILLTCQYEEDLCDSSTFGPFPLDFFVF